MMSTKKGGNRGHHSQGVAVSASGRRREKPPKATIQMQGRGNVSFTGSVCVLGEVLEQQAGHPLRVRLQGRLMDVLDDLEAVG